MTVTRRIPLRRSRGTVIPPEVRNRVLVRDGALCVCDLAGFPPEANATCWGSPVELDHVRGSGGMGMKSPSTVDNLVCLSAPCHRWKTEHGREARPLLLAYLARVEDPHAAHVDPAVGCAACYEAVPR